MEDIDKALSPTSGEVGMYAKDKSCGIHCREDGCIEIYAGSSSILIDSDTGTISIKGTVINNIAGKINNLSDTNTFNLPSGTLSSEYMPDICTEKYLRSPVVQRSANALDTKILVGVPKEGQKEIKLSEILESKELITKVKTGATFLSRLKEEIFG